MGSSGPGCADTGPSLIDIGTARIRRACDHEICYER